VHATFAVGSMRLISGILVSFVCCGVVFPQRSALTVPRNVVQLSQQAATIVRGNVTSVRVEPHPQLTNLITIVVSLRVTEKLKGNPGPMLTFRQFVWDIRDKYDAAGYRKGQDLLLLLNPTSSYGLTSPVGMEQGRFQVSRDKQGRVTAVNGHANVGLFSNLLQAQQPASQISPATRALITVHRNGPVPLLQLEEVMRGLGGVSR
jgi:hypothetical protein